MTLRILSTTALLTIAGTTAFGAAHAGKMGYALADDGSTLIVMADISAPGEVMTYELSDDLDAIAYRPVTGDLLGFKNGMIYTINTSTGELTDLGASFGEGAMVGDDSMVAFDFNNAIDAVRAVSSTGDNLVYFPDDFGDNDERAGTVVRMTDLAWAEGDANEGVEPNVYANAYTNAVAGTTAESTFQYGLDANANALISIANNEGTLASIGYITVDGETVDLAPMGGFDIFSPEVGSDEAYAILQLEGAETAGLYSINLETAEATMLADLGMGDISGFAVSGGM